MKSITDFEEWFGSGNEPLNYEEANDLYQAANGRFEGSYTGKVVDEKIYINGKTTTLVLVNENAVRAFIWRIDCYRKNKELDWEASVILDRSLKKKDRFD